MIESGIRRGLSIGACAVAAYAHQDRLSGAPRGAKLSGKRESVDIGQAHVEQYGFGVMSLNGLDRGAATMGHVYFEAFHLQDQGERFTGIDAVVDDKDPARRLKLCHGGGI